MGGLAVWPLSGSNAAAHEIRPAIMDASVGQTMITLIVRAPIEPLIARIDLASLQDTSASPRAGLHDALRSLSPEQLEARFRADWPRIVAGFRVVSDGRVVRLSLAGVDIPEIGDVRLPRDARIEIHGLLPPGTAPVAVGWLQDFGALVLRQGDDDTSYTAFLSPGAISEPLPRDRLAQDSFSDRFLVAVALGFIHILPDGADHIFFVLGLFLYSPAGRVLLMQVSAFTLAHTVTLALATSGLVALPTQLVETLIAGSIAFVAFENIARSSNQKLQVGARRLSVVFAFGLLHGLGFAKALTDIEFSTEALLTDLIGFNLGVEFGQITILVAAFLLLAWPFAKRNWYRERVVIPCSLVIGAIGLYWAYERLGIGPFLPSWSAPFSSITDSGHR